MQANKKFYTLLIAEMVRKLSQLVMIVRYLFGTQMTIRN